MCLSRDNGAALLTVKAHRLSFLLWRMQDLTRSIGLALILTLVLVCQPQARPFGSRMVLDDARYERLSLAARLMRSDYANLPPRNSATPFKIKSFKRLFRVHERRKTLLVKKSLAEEKPVVVALPPFASLHSARTVWTPLPEEYRQRAVSPRQSESYPTLIVVAYDDVKYGGAFEVMHHRKGRHGFVWIRYKDFDHFCRYAFELVEDAPGPSAVVQLTGAVHFKQLSGAIMSARPQGRVYRLAQAYPSGTQFQIIITAGPAYVYALSSDLTHTMHRLFPPDEGISAHLAYRQNHIVLPDEDHYFQLDDIPGTDYVCVLYSRDKLDLSTILHEMRRAKGSFLDRLHTVLGEDFVAATNIRYALSGEVRFTALSRQKRIVPIVVEIRHTGTP